MIVFGCEKCGHTIHTEDFMAGGKGKCPQCAAIVDVPEESTAAAQESGKPSPSQPREAPRSATPHAAMGEQRCSRCTAKIKPDDKVCGYCKEPLSGEGPRKEAAPITLRRVVPPQSTLGRVIKVGGLLALIAAALAYSLSSMGPGEAEEVPSSQVCESNMERLFKMVESRIESDLPLPESKGKAFWVHLAGEGEGRRLVVCEEAVRRGIGRGAVYRGPKDSFENLPEHAPIACDPPGLHVGGMRVLYRNGTVRWVEEETKEYAVVIRETSE